MSWIWQDLRFALGGFRKDRGFTSHSEIGIRMAIGAAVGLLASLRSGNVELVVVVLCTAGWRWYE
jgi:hypothetical protein